MKATRTILILITIGFTNLITSCNNRQLQPAPESKRLELDSSSQYQDQHYRVYTLEGCQYIVVGYGKTRWGSHKGNCSNDIHKRD